MLWFWFVVGLIIGVIGVFVMAYDGCNLAIGGMEFDTEILGQGMTIAGFVLAIIMLLGNGIVWMNGVMV